MLLSPPVQDSVPLDLTDALQLQSSLARERNCQLEKVLPQLSNRDSTYNKEIDWREEGGKGGERPI